MSGHYESKITKTDWVTPEAIIESLGPFDLDPCAGKGMPWATANRMASGDSELSDGLAFTWQGTVWLNPPYGTGEIEPWLEKMAGHGCGIALLPARTDTAWFHDYVFTNATAILWRKGRIQFCDRQGNPISGNTIGSVFVAYGWYMVGRLARNEMNPAVGNGGYLEVLG